VGVSGCEKIAAAFDEPHRHIIAVRPRCAVVRLLAQLKAIAE
jgi:hypothetical protein